ncbi:MAG: superoxide dismutase family protein, partial [Mycobacteriaceae bacterium]|nr:superoxide dismutase family protein [Mycobacteriaceae bacterium]
ACSPPGQVQSNQPGTTPPVWTGSSSPGASPAAQAAGTQTLRAQLKSPDGTTVANATFDFANGYATVTVETVAGGILSPGFHGMHIHQVGKCEANSVAPTGGAPGDFNSAGGHFQVAGHTAHPASGDLTSIQVRGDGSARVVTTTDTFTAADLLGGEKTAIVIHAKPDNFGNIPPEKYSQVNGTPGPDENTLATGDAGGRVACGVIGPG